MKCYAIVVWQPHVITPRRYKGRFQRTPRINVLKVLGVDYVEKRGDKIHISEVTEELYHVLKEFEWISADSRGAARAVLAQLKS